MEENGGVLDFQGKNGRPRVIKNAILEGSGGSGSDIEVVQTTGQSTTAVMSQKAVSDNLTTINTALGNKANNTTFSAGNNGLVPAPASGDSGKFLKGDGTWGEAGGSTEEPGVATFYVKPVKIGNITNYMLYGSQDALTPMTWGDFLRVLFTLDQDGYVTSVNKTLLVLKSLTSDNKVDDVIVSRDFTRLSDSMIGMNALSNPVFTASSTIPFLRYIEEETRYQCEIPFFEFKQNEEQLSFLSNPTLKKLSYYAVINL